MKNVLLQSILGLLLLTSVANAQNMNPPLLKKGATLWYRCSIKSAEGEWAIKYFPTQFELFLGDIVSNTQDVTAWKGNLSFFYRNGSVRMREADVSQTSGFIENDPHKGFIPYTWLAKDPSGDFEFRENIDSKTGWSQGFQLTLNSSRGFYDCLVIEPMGLHH